MIFCNLLTNPGKFLLCTVLGMLFATPALAVNNAGQAFSLWPDTGQTSCYSDFSEYPDYGWIPCPSPDQALYGQDAHYAGPARSYTKLDADGNDLQVSAITWAMVRDNTTGLIWEIKEAGISGVDYTNPRDRDNLYTWCDTNPETNGGNPGTCGDNDTEDFLAALNSLNDGSGFGGHTDWRLPTIQELKTLVNRGRAWAAMDATYFQDSTVSPVFWSSTTPLSNTSRAWGVSFGTGIEPSYPKSGVSSYRVRAVRGGQQPSADRFVDNSDGTITDTTTCLEWQQTALDSTGDGVADLMTWEVALAEVENSSMGGHDDWRLPNYNELASIVDYSRNAPAIDTTVFPDTVSFTPYWSSTTYYPDAGNAWSVSFSNGAGSNSFKSGEYAGTLYVRPVRGGCVSWDVTATAGENGVLDPGTPSLKTVSHGNTTYFTFNADTGFHVASVFGCGIDYSNTSSEVTSYTATTGAITEECTVSATFAGNLSVQHEIITSTTGNGTISPSGSVQVEHGSDQVFTVTPGLNHHVVEVLVDGVSVGAVASYTFMNVTEAHTISASFAIDTHIIMATTLGNGTISPSGSVQVEHGSDQVFTVTPDPNHHVVDVQVDGVSMGNTITEYTFYNVTDNHVISAQFYRFPWPMFLPAIMNKPEPDSLQ